MKKQAKTTFDLCGGKKKKCTNCIQITDDTHVMSMKIDQSSRPCTHLVQLRPKFSHPLELARPISTPPLPLTPLHTLQMIEKET